jgi:Na+/proline symporter
MLSATLYGLARFIIHWHTNKLLFWAGILVVLITIFVGTLQTLKSDSFELMWMLLYTIPIGLLVFGQVAGLAEMNNQALKIANLPPIPSVFPGESRDYESAALGHYLSMAFPLVARVVAWIVGIAIEQRK